jgi:hypothetical protein
VDGIEEEDGHYREEEHVHDIEEAERKIIGMPTVKKRMRCIMIVDTYARHNR